MRDTLESLQGEWTPPGLTGGEGLPQERWWAHRLLLTESPWWNAQTLRGAAHTAPGLGGAFPGPIGRGTCLGSRVNKASLRAQHRPAGFSFSSCKTGS